MDYPIPKDSAEVYRQHKGQPHQNPGLIFDRFIPDWGSERGKDAKREAWDEVATACNKGDSTLLHEWNIRWQQTVAAMHADTFSLSTDWRLIAGLGNKGPLEAGFTFHRYGFPILPGSSVKGIVRTWALLEVAEKLKTEKLNELDEVLGEGEKETFDKAFQKFSPSEEAKKWGDKFRTVFGTMAQAGHAVFFDAIPERRPKLELDVMTPHYAPYYQDNKNKTPPANWHNPTPILFLTVAAGQPFFFAVGWRGKLDKNLQKQVIQWLKDGLMNLGAGAKTSAGYGYFLLEDVARGETDAMAKKEKELYAVKKHRLLQETPTGRLRGSVVDVHPTGRYGKINPTRGGAQMFVHSSQMKNNKTLLEGQIVEYRIGQYQGRDQAQDVNVLLEP